MKHRHILLLLLLPAFALAAIIGEPAYEALTVNFAAPAVADTTVVHSTDTIVGAESDIHSAPADGVQSAGDGSTGSNVTPQAQLPEPPATDAFVPTMMSDLEAADPTAGLTFITPPTANDRGTASLSYPLQMPPARNGMQPQIALSYSSDGGSGWLGEGWDIDVPAITVDTRWGVPRYDTANETETYLLNGQMLCFTGSDGQMHVAHRGTPQQRAADRRFFTRQGGDFARIIRHGSSPSDYYWEVTDTRGTRYFYGQTDNSRLTGTVGGHTVIAEWRLCSVRELHGDRMDYIYDRTAETSTGGLPSRAIYLSRIEVSDTVVGGTTPYNRHTTVAFARKTGAKRISQGNARYGFLTSSNALLDNVAVSFRGSQLRSYRFAFSEGTFHRERLDSICQYDGSGTLVSFQAFNYYDDTEGGTKLFADSLTVLTSSTTSDGAGLLALGGTDAGSPTLLGASKTKSTSGSLYVGVGKIDGKPGKDGTAGIATNYGRSTAEGLVTLVDIDGDGLPDKVYKRGGSLYYSPLHMTSSGSYAFGPEKSIHGRSTYSKNKSSNFSIGPQIYRDNTVVGGGVNFSKTTTTDYFSDVNGDGLADIVSGDKVYFNHLEGGEPVFTLSSLPTPSPVEGGGSVDAAVCEAAPDEQAQILSSSPMQDVVRVWHAPHTGTVVINTKIALLQPKVDEDIDGTPDGVTVELQINGTRQMQQHIAAGDYSEHIFSKICHVSAGDRVYFRLRCGSAELSNGSADRVKWGGTISYSGPAADDLTDANGYYNYIYDLKEASFTSARMPLPVEGGSFKLTGRLDMPRVSDDTYFRVYTVGADGTVTPAFQYHQPYNVQNGYHGVLEAEIPNKKGNIEAYCEVYSTTNVRWDLIKWRPQLVVDGDTIDAAVHYYTYDVMHRPARPFRSPFQGKVYFKPIVQLNGAAPKFCTYAIKKKDQLVFGADIAYGIYNYLPSHSTYLNKTDTFWVDICGDEEFVSHIVGTPQLKIWQQGGDTITVDCSVYGHTEASDTLGYGQNYRCWGRFVYNAAEGRYAGAIDERLLTNDYSCRTDTIDASKEPLIQMSPDFSGLHDWAGANDMVWIKGDTVSTARLVVNDVSHTNPLETYSGTQSGGFTAMGFPVITKGSSSDVMGEGSVGPLSATLNAASGGSSTQLMTLDMNGDGYPDLVGNKKISYTDQRGQIGVVQCEGFAQENSNESVSLSTGGQPQFSFSTHGKNGKSGTARGSEQQAGSGKNAHISSQLNGNAGGNNDTLESTYADINGDGLPDYLMKSGGGISARLNLGYAFAPACSLGVSTIGCSSSSVFSPSIGVGLGFDKWKTSFAGGIGVAATENMEVAGLYDVNGDGLPDLVNWDGQTCSVSFNNGHGFDNTVAVNLLSGLSRNASLSTSGNVAATITVKVFGLKTAICPGVSHARSIDRQLLALRDIDGDGYLDIVMSDRPDLLKVRFSRIRRTGKLRTVRNSLGGTFTLDYAHAMPSYGLPGGKWVLSEVTIDDGIHDDGPVQRTRFEYFNGRHDRHEREFLGFGQVHALELDTEHGDALYRRSVMEYDVSSYYTQGQLLATSVLDADSSLYTKTTNSYYAYNLRHNGSKYLFSEATGTAALSNDAGMTYCPLHYTETTQYEGDAADGHVMAQTWYAYDISAANGNSPYGALIERRFSDWGTMDKDGVGYHLLTRYGWGNLPSRNLIRRLGSVVNMGPKYSLLSATSYTYADGDVYNLLLPVEENDTLSKNRKKADCATTSFAYDIYGNTTHMLLPPNAKGQRMGYTYTYDDERHMYVTGVTDSLGYHSHTGRIDYRYGMPLERTDINNKLTRIYIDDMGRTVRYVSPLEMSHISGTHPAYDDMPSVFTVKNEYHPMAVLNADGSIKKPAYAVTQHYDTLRVDGPVETITFVDGFGRPVQLKKESAVNGTRRYACSGKILYDAFGRTIKEWYPVVQAPPYRLQYYLGHDNVNPTVTAYDVLDRPTQVTLPDGVSFQTAYLLTAIGAQNVTEARTADPLGNSSSVCTNGSGLTAARIQYKDGMVPVTTTFVYDPLRRISTVTDAEDNTTTSSYDMLGRRTIVIHPASGITTFTYDKAGNLTCRQTAQLKKESASILEPDIRPWPSSDTLVVDPFDPHPAHNLNGLSQPDGLGLEENFNSVYPFSPVNPSDWHVIKFKNIHYTYTFNRLDGISYPDNSSNDVSYTWGGPGADGNCAGRIACVHDATGATEYAYDALGAKVSEHRSIAIPFRNSAATAESYLTRWSYDSFGRTLSMVYPDGETVYYGYDCGGQLNSVSGSINEGHDRTTPEYHYVNDIWYDKFGARGKAVFGDGTTCLYTYDAKRRWMTGMTIKKGSASICQYGYTYDAMGNISQLVDGDMVTTLAYDGRYRLSEAHSSSSSYAFHILMAYDDVYRVTRKSQIVVKNPNRPTEKVSGYDLSYSYNKNVSKAHFQLSAITEIQFRQENNTTAMEHYGHTFTYDANGNLISDLESRLKNDGHTEPQALVTRMLWDEENRLTAISENGYVSNYWYDADGERTIKVHGGNTSLFRNARAVADSVHSVTNTDLTVYASPFFVRHCDKTHGWTSTKHIFAAGERLVSQELNRSYGDANVDRGDYADAPHMDYAALRTSMEHAVKKAYEQLGVHYEGSDTVAAMTKPRKTGDLPGDAAVGEETRRFFYHKDHLGGTSIVTDKDGNVAQRLTYLPYGEVFTDALVDSSFVSPYKFTGKEFDEETGLYYFGARYYNPKYALWLSCDPLQEKYPNTTSCNYCLNNPISSIDVDGNYVVVKVNDKTSYIYYKGHFYKNKLKKEKGHWIITGNRLMEPKNPNSFISKTLYALRKLDNSKNSKIREVFNKISDLDNTFEHRIMATNGNSRTSAQESNVSIIRLNYRLTEENHDYDDFKNIGVTDLELLGHEISHSYDNQLYLNRRGIDKATGVKINEIEAVKFENLIRKEEGKPLRKTFDNIRIPLND